MNLIKGNIDYFLKKSWSKKDPMDNSYHKNKIFDAVSSFDLDKVGFKDNHFVEIIERARKKNVGVLGDIHKEGMRNHFESLQNLAIMGNSYLSDKYLLVVHDNYVIARPHNTSDSDSDSVIIVNGLFQEYSLTPSKTDPTSICMVTLGNQNPSNSLEEHLNRATNSDEIILGFHWGTVSHNNWWLKYDIPSAREKLLLRIFSQQEDLILVSVADSAFHMVRGNECTKSLVDNRKNNINHIWTSNAKNQIKNIGVAGVYIENQMIDEEQLIPSLKFVLNNGLYINKEKYLNPVSWFLNTGIPQGIKPLFKNKKQL